MSFFYCAQCEGKISDRLDICPHCGNPVSIDDNKKNESDDKYTITGTITVGIIIATVVIGGAMVISGIIKSERSKGKQRKIRAIQARQQKSVLVAECEKQIRKLIKQGGIHSVNAEFNQARIEPAVWSFLSLEEKQGLVIFFSKYFDAADSTGRVEILSNRNDTKLATYSVWSGMEILQ